MTTTTQVKTIAGALDEANPNQVADALRKVKLGSVLTPNIQTFTGLTAAAAHDITDDEHGNLTAILVPVNCRVTAGAAAAGNRYLGDAGATPAAPGANGVGICSLSADGTTITFEGNVTAFVLTYVPRSEEDITGDFEDAP